MNGLQALKLFETWLGLCYVKELDECDCPKCVAYREMKKKIKNS
jgi:hypothetical protein|tara:strand:+ start:2591 stop:2722 length:132 start_codon:yes stop_codon:yes gene_type:complete